MRSFAVGDGKPLKLTADMRGSLKQYLVTETKRAQDGRYALENTWREDLRQYEGQPQQRVGWVPFENAPYTEVTTGASSCDTILGQSESLIFAVKPPLTVRSRKEQFDEAADALQDLVNWGIESGSWNFEPAMKECLIDCIQLGTMVAYIPFTKTQRVTDVRKTVTMGPRIRSVAVEFFVLPANATKNVQEARFATMIVPMSKSELQTRRRLSGWSIDDTGSADGDSPVRKDRMRTAGVDEDSGAQEPVVKVAFTDCYFDFGDGMGERDLQVIWNSTSGGIMKCTYNDYNCRPFELECYQDRAHIAFGLGVMRMDSGYQKMCSDIWNNHVWNMMIANTKMYQMPESMMGESEEIYPGKRFGLTGDGEVKAIDMGQVNNSGPEAFNVVKQLGQDRVGVSDLTGPIEDVNRTPVGSMQQAFSQAGKRFTHPFNNMRNFAANCIKQCLYRIQERVRTGDMDVIAQLVKILGPEKAAEVEKIFRSSEVELTDAIDVQLTAASVDVNQDADRQNATILATQIFPLYWNAKKELVQYIAQPPFPGADLVAKEADALLENFKNQIFKTFPQISDPRKLTISLEPLNQKLQQLNMPPIQPQIPGAGAGNGVVPSVAPGAPVLPATLPIQ